MDEYLGTGPLSNLRASADSDDQMISATLSHGGRLDIWINQSAYRNSQEEILGSRLGTLLTDVWAEYRRRYFRLVSDAVGTTVREDDHEGGERTRRFREEWRSMPLQGMSPNHRIRMRSESLARWQVEVRPGTLHTLDRDDFVAEFIGAFQATLDDYHQKLALLRDEHFNQKSHVQSTTKEWRRSER